MHKSIYSVAAFILAASLAGPVATAEETILEPPRAITLWWVIFNNPDACVANQGGVEQCGEADVFGQAYVDSVANGTPDPSLIAPNLDAGVAVLYASGGATTRTGRIRLVASMYRSADGGGLDIGSGETFVDPLGLGTAFENPNAEIHLVARDHGPQIPGELHAQILNFLDPHCSDPLLGWYAGPNTCQDVQFAVFAPTESGTDAIVKAADGTAMPFAQATLIRNGDMVQAIFDTRITGD